MNLSTSLNRLLAACLTALMVLATASCSGRDGAAPAAPPGPVTQFTPRPMAQEQARAGKLAADASAVPAAPSPAAESSPERFLAVRHELAVEVAPDHLADTWTRTRDLCGSLRCEVLSSSLRRETPQSPGGASLELRVSPGDVDRLFESLSSVAQVVSHSTTSEDKTAEVIDVEAHIRNRTEFRDSLRTMLRESNAERTMADLLEIQRTLADTQAELDSRAMQRKSLEQQTSKQHIQIQFSPTRALVRGGSFSPIGQALDSAGSVLGESLAVFITVAAAGLPWLVLGIVLLWVLRAWWRRGRRRA